MALEITVDLLIEDDRWPGEAALLTLCETSVQSVLASHGVEVPVEVSVLAAHDAKLAELNGAFRGKTAPTNVLSWPAETLAIGALPAPDPDGIIFLGDMALGFETVSSEATVENKSINDHICHLIVHSTLHLLGYDHLNDAEAAVMEELEAAALARLGIADPYSTMA